jgi:hypothetical protein
MIKLHGSYTEEGEEFTYAGRVFLHEGVYYNGIAEVIQIKNGDILRAFEVDKPHGGFHGPWFAHYRKLGNGISMSDIAEELKKDPPVYEMCLCDANCGESRAHVKGSFHCVHYGEVIIDWNADSIKCPHCTRTLDRDNKLVPWKFSPAYHPSLSGGGPTCPHCERVVRVIIKPNL